MLIKKSVLNFTNFKTECSLRCSYFFGNSSLDVCIKRVLLRNKSIRRGVLNRNTVNRKNIKSQAIRKAVLPHCRAIIRREISIGGLKGGNLLEKINEDWILASKAFDDRLEETPCA